MSDFHLKVDDLAPVLSGELLLSTGETADLSGSTVTFSMRLLHSTGTPKVNAQPVTILDATAGTVEYRWQSGDTDTVGTYAGAFKILKPGAKPQTHPNRSFIMVEIQDSVLVP